MKADACEGLVASLCKRHGTRDPALLAERMGIHIYETELSRLKGMYRVILRRRCIFINANLDEDTRRLVLAHEIGHDCLHRDLAKGNGLQEFMLLDMTARPEYEANCFAAALLLPDAEITELIYQYGYNAAQIASAMRTNVNLVALKIDSLRLRGYDLSGLEHDSRFLKE